MSDESIKLRQSQEEILRYHFGKMGISAVPGSGKTWTLSYLAADLIQSGFLAPDQEILIVTLVNAAVDNFSTRISAQLQAKNLFPGFGYRVRTLHGLANDIVRERPDLVGLGNDYQIIDDAESTRIKEQIAQDWLHTHPDFFEPYLDYDDHQRQNVYENKRNLPSVVNQMANAFIRLAKDHQVAPEACRRLLQDSPVQSPLVEMGTAIYSDYQDALNYRGSVDFDDLIRLALRCLRSDPALVILLRQRWPYILEDEAQDSSLLQQEILSLLAGDGGNWVRVGDPNQAIYETFTTASPQYLLDFLKQEDVDQRYLPESGRSTLSIINLANRMIEWVRHEHPNPHARDALNLPLILPTPANDPQPNPPDCPECIRLIERALTSDEELHFVVNAIEEFLGEHSDRTIAILAPSNDRGFKFADVLKKRGIPCVDSLLRSTSATRLSTGALANILNYLGDPANRQKLSAAYRVWRRAEREDDENWPFYKKVAGVINRCEFVEDYVWQTITRDWLENLPEVRDDPAIQAELETFREVVRRWHGAVSLPIDQLILSIAQDLFLEPVELALAHKLSSLLRQFSNAHPDWRLPEFTRELTEIAKNQRKFLGFSQEDDAFDPDRYPGQVVVTTMHKAKGLEWDCVFLTSLNNYDFPSGDDFDSYQSEKWFAKDNLNLEAEILAQFNALMEAHPYRGYQLGKASLEARQEFIRERLRLFFVGITRAKRWLTATWNTGRGMTRNVAALPLLEMINYLERRS